MTSEYSSAIDEILGIFKTAWDTYTPALNGGSAVTVYWEGIDSNSPPSPDQAYAEPVVRHTDSYQATFGPVGARRFTEHGLFTVQIYSPVSDGRGLYLGQELAKIVRTAFVGVGTESGIWFRNVRIREVGSKGTWNQFNVIAEFEYDTIE